MLEADSRDDVDILILTGTDPAFCAGVDLKEAQRAIARNWIAAYALYMRAPANQKGLRTVVRP